MLAEDKSLAVQKLKPRNPERNKRVGEHRCGLRRSGQGGGDGWLISMNKQGLGSDITFFTFTVQQLRWVPWLAGDLPNGLCIGCFLGLNILPLDVFRATWLTSVTFSMRAPTYCCLSCQLFSFLTLSSPSFLLFLDMLWFCFSPLSFYQLTKSLWNMLIGYVDCLSSASLC